MICVTGNRLKTFHIDKDIYLYIHIYTYTHTHIYNLFIYFLFSFSPWVLSAFSSLHHFWCLHGTTSVCGVACHRFCSTKVWVWCFAFIQDALKWVPNAHCSAHVCTGDEWNHGLVPAILCTCILGYSGYWSPGYGCQFRGLTVRYLIPVHNTSHRAKNQRTPSLPAGA